MTEEAPMSLLNDKLSIRINSQMKSDFIQKCEQLHREHQHIMREFISAFVDGRLTINPTEEQKKTIKETYNVD
jgi:hypothetical protein